MLVSPMCYPTLSAPAIPSVYLKITTHRRFTTAFRYLLLIFLGLIKGISRLVALDSVLVCLLTFALKKSFTKSKSSGFAKIEHLDKLIWFLLKQLCNPIYFLLHIQNGWAMTLCEVLIAEG